jgi:acyl-coenzyme A thioesterase PaaI-like protein
VSDVEKPSGGGASPESSGPEASGREAASEALASLVAEVRALIDATVTTVAPLEVLRAAQDAVRIATRDLATHVPDPRPARYPEQLAGSAVNDFFPFDIVLGRFNPLAVPMEVEWREPRAIGRVRFGTPYEGPPGCVHGAVIAAAFDQILNAANLMRGNPGPTRKLEIRYRRPTPLGENLVFEGWQERTEGREIFAAGRLMAGDVVTAEAEGVFVHLSADQVMRLLERGSS